jgi:hypothetical protein
VFRLFILVLFSFCHKKIYQEKEIEMGDYVVNTEELRRAAQQLVNKANEMRSAVTAVDSALAPARAMKAPRVAKDIQQWDAIKASLQKLFSDSESASKIINTTATDVDTVLN